MRIHWVGKALEILREGWVGFGRFLLGFRRRGIEN